jgi:toxin ParE1/3/4
MSKRIRWLNIALNDLDKSIEYLAQRNINAANKLAERIWNSVELLLNNPKIGRPGRILGTRELVISGTSYIIPYRIKDDEIQILRVLHGARKWPITFSNND